MLFTVNTTWQQFSVLALFVIAAVISGALGQEALAQVLLGMAGGALTVSRGGSGGEPPKQLETKPERAELPPARVVSEGA